MNGSGDVSDELKKVNADLSFVMLILAWHNLLHAKTENLGDNIRLEIGLLKTVQVIYPRNRPVKISLWLAIADLRQYFIEETSKPRWKLIKKIILSFTKTKWGKNTSIKTEYSKRRKLIEDYYKGEFESYWKMRADNRGFYEKIIRDEEIPFSLGEEPKIKNYYEAHYRWLRDLYGDNVRESERADWIKLRKRLKMAIGKKTPLIDIIKRRED